MAKKVLTVAFFSLSLLLALSACAKDQNDRKSETRKFAGQSLLIFAGAASRPPAEEIADLFEKRTGAKVNLNFGGSGKMLSEMELARQGDIYFPGSSDWMEKADEHKIVFPKTERRIVYLVSSINVQKGNPKKIKSLKDLLRPDVRVAIATPETVCVGAYAVEILQKNFSADEIKQFRENNLVNYPESCEKTANAISLQAVDAVIGWRVFEEWDPKRIETVKLEPDELARIGYVPIAVAKFSKNRQLSQAFVDFLTSPRGISIFKKHGYFVTGKEAQTYAGAKKALPVGGWYNVPKTWLVR